jgi:dienelactone hydrolase
MEDQHKGCCPPGSWPYLAPDYTPKGTEEKIDDVPVYTIGKGDKAVVVIPDAFGPEAGRHKAFCDQIAEAGYYVVLVDVFKGDRYTNPDFSGIRAWLANYSWEKVEDDIINKVIPHVTNKGVKRIAMAGFCYGSCIVFGAASTGKIDLGLSFHPSLHAFGEPDSFAEKVKCPQLVCPAGNDPESVKEGNSVEKILRSRDFGDKNKFRNFPEMQHGWMIRSDLKVAENLRDYKLGMELALDYLKQHL